MKIASLLFFSGMLCGLTPALAQSASSSPPNKTSHYSGFYADVGVGVLNTQINNVSHFTWTMPNFPATSYATTFTQQSSIITTPILGHFGVGYQIIRRHFIFSLAPFIELASINVNNNADFQEILFEDFVNFQQIHIRWTSSYGIDLKPGWMATPNTAIYLLFGVSRQNITIENSGHGSGNDPRFGEASPSVTQRRSATGLRYGFGLQSWLARHWAIYFNYVYTRYPNQTLNLLGAPTGGIIANNSITLATQLRRFSSNKIVVGFNYYFLHAHTLTPWNFPTHAMSWRGFLIGLQAGALINQYWHRGTFLQLTTSGINPENNLLMPLAQMGRTSAHGSLNLGFAMPWRRLYFELASAINVGSHHAHDQTLDRQETGSVPVLLHKNQLTLREAEWSIDFLPGLLLTPHTVLHLRFGAAFNRATLTSLSRSVSAGAFITMPLMQQKHLTGLRLGLGIKQAITARMSLTANYIYTDYGYISVTGTQPGGSNAVLRSFSRLYMNTQAFLLGLECRL